jgi:hypothetical protein
VNTLDCVVLCRLPLGELQISLVARTRNRHTIIEAKGTAECLVRTSPYRQAAQRFR